MAKKNIWSENFTDFISYEKIGRFRFFGRRHPRFMREELSIDSLHAANFLIFKLAIFCILFIFLARLFILAIANGEKNRALADENRIRLLRIEPLRGKIFDRNGKILADSRQVFLLKKGPKVSEISAKQVKDLESQGLAGEDFEGELGKITANVERLYPFKEVTSHVLGFIARAEQADFEKNPRLSGEDLVGRLGVELSYDDFLRGETGKKLVEVDSKEQKVSILGRVEPVKGKDLFLTLDSDLQEFAYNALRKHAEVIGSKKGALIIQHPNTGEVLALVSVPSFDPNDVSRFLNNKDQPFFNRVVQGTYPPGSIFKIVSALSGLESGKITKDTEIEDVGEFYLGDTRFSNWFYTSYGRRDGILKISRAIARSNDIFFYRLAEMTNLAPIRQMAINLGFGQKTGVDLPGEAFGLVPDNVWKKSTFNTDWYLGDTLHLAIGQGFMLATPIQINKMTSFVASGKLTNPYLALKISGDGEEMKFGGKVVEENLVKGENLKIVREGMKEACSTGGTGWPFFNAPYEVGCKTGTAEKTLGNPHAWFTVFAPFENPQVSVTVIIEEGGEGSSVAGPVAREILDWWFLKNIKN